MTTEQRSTLGKLLAGPKTITELAGEERMAIRATERRLNWAQAQGFVNVNGGPKLLDCIWSLTEAGRDYV